MVLNIFDLLLPRKFLGIDIGTAFVKIVEISKFGYRKRLGNYGALPASVMYEKPFRTFEKSTLLLSTPDIARAILAITEESKIKSRQAIFSIPDFATFFTTVELPPMTKDELPQAIRYEARQYVPLPLSEITLDWQIIESKISEGKKMKYRILLAAVPNEVINQYREIARLAEFELVALEAEVFGLMRSLVEEDVREPVGIIDIGAQSTTCSIVEKKILQVSHSVDTAGNEFTQALSKGLGVAYGEAEEIKKKYGISPDIEKGRESRQILLPIIDIIFKETEKLFGEFAFKKQKEVQKIILAGGSAWLPGLKEYFAENLKKEIEIAFPFSGVFYAPILEKTLREMGPAYAIAAGAALRGLEYY